MGVQGDYQLRFWNTGVGDLERSLLRTGVTYRPKSEDIMFTLGYAYIGTGAYGESDAMTAENRIYQEALFSQKIASRFHPANESNEKRGKNARKAPSKLICQRF